MKKVFNGALTGDRAALVALHAMGIKLETKSHDTNSWIPSIIYTYPNDADWPYKKNKYRIADGKDI